MYIIAVILLVTSVFHAAALLRQGLYVVLGLNDTAMPYSYNRDLITLTPDAEAYLNNLENERTQQLDKASFLRSSISLVISLAFLYFFWSRTGRSVNIDMQFSVRNFYFFLVSGLAFLIFFFSLTSGVSNFVQSSVVGDRLYYYDLYKTYPPAPIDGTPEKRTVGLEELKENLAAQQLDYSNQYQRSQKRQVVDQLTIALVALPVFLLHDRKFSF